MFKLGCKKDEVFYLTSRKDTKASIDLRKVVTDFCKKAKLGESEQGQNIT